MAIQKHKKYEVYRKGKKKVANYSILGCRKYIYKNIKLAMSEKMSASV